MNALNLPTPLMKLGMIYLIDLMRFLPGREGQEATLLEQVKMKSSDRSAVIARAEKLLQSRGPIIGAHEVCVRDSTGAMIFADELLPDSFKNPLGKTGLAT